MGKGNIGLRGHKGKYFFNPNARYYCIRCQQEHNPNSKIGKEHTRYDNTQQEPSKFLTRRRNHD